jgi:hypothetical protein
VVRHEQRAAAAATAAAAAAKPAAAAASAATRAHSLSGGASGGGPNKGNGDGVDGILAEFAPRKRKAPERLDPTIGAPASVSQRKGGSKSTVRLGRASQLPCVHSAAPECGRAGVLMRFARSCAACCAGHPGGRAPAEGDGAPGAGANPAAAGTTSVT